jgi:SAM-dependent methyltransferase
MNDRNPNEVRNFYSQPRFVDEAEFSRDPVVEHEQKCRYDALVSLLDDYALALDAGCGNGRYFNMLIEHSGQIVGVDFSKDMLRMARSKADNLPVGQASVLFGDLTRLPFRDGSFDLIASIEVLEHVPNWEQSISEFHRLLKPGGSMILSLPNKFSMYGLTRYASRLFIKSENPCDQWKTYFELRNVSTRAGFSINGVRGVCYLPGDLSYYQPFKWVIIRCLCISRFLQRILSTRWPFHSLGYSIVIKGEKVVEASKDKCQ